MFSSIAEFLAKVPHTFISNFFVK